MITRWSRLNLVTDQQKRNNPAKAMYDWEGQEKSRSLFLRDKR